METSAPPTPDGRKGSTRPPPRRDASLVVSSALHRILPSVNDPVIKPPSPARRPPWTSMLAAPLALAAAILLFRTLRAQPAPSWAAALAAVAVFPILPLAWHILAERRTSARFPLLDRFALRTMSLAVVVLGVSLGTL